MIQEMKTLAIGDNEYEVVDEKARPVKSVAEMKAIENLVAGNIIKTIGYYSANDGGGATYLIRERLESDVEDLGAIHFINETLVAELIIENKSVNIKQFGAKGDGLLDDTTIINYVVNTIPNTVINKIYFDGTFKISSSINVGSGKDLIGIKENLQFNNYGTKFITSENITMINCVQKTNILIKNIILEHPSTNTLDVIDITGARYIDLVNIQSYHNGESANCIVVNDTNTENTSIWSGYININNLRALNYKIGIKSKATFIKIKNCVINNTIDYAIWLLSEGIGGIEGCDITGEGKAIRYDGTYSLNLENCYFEGYYADRFIENTNSVEVNMKGCKIYIPNGGQTQLNGKYVETTEQRPQILKNNNSQLNGYGSFKNLFPFGSGKVVSDWQKRNGNGTITSMSKSEMNDLGIGLPLNFDSCIRIENERAIKKIYEKFNPGEWITLSFWVYVEETSTAKPNCHLYNGPTSEPKYCEYNSLAIEGKWKLRICYMQIPENYNDDEFLIFQIGNNPCVLYVTGINISRGINTSMDVGYTPSQDKVITDRLMLKGTDNNYYELKYNPTTSSIEATQITNFR